jgi:hypothetical protein
MYKGGPEHRMSMPLDGVREYYSTHGAGGVLGVSHATVLNMVRDGRLVPSGYINGTQGVAVLIFSLGYLLRKKEEFAAAAAAKEAQRREAPKERPRDGRGSGKAKLNGNTNGYANNWDVEEHRRQEREFEAAAAGAGTPD